MPVFVFFLFAPGFKYKQGAFIYNSDEYTIGCK